MHIPTQAESSRGLNNTTLKGWHSDWIKLPGSYRAESKNDFIHKIGIVEKEASETEYWLEVIDESHVLDKHASKQLIPLIKESKELLALFTSISKNSKKR